MPLIPGDRDHHGRNPRKHLPRNSCVGRQPLHTSAPPNIHDHHLARTATPWSRLGPAIPQKRCPPITSTAKEARPLTGSTRNKPLVVEWWEVRHRFLTDVEGQSATPLSGRREGPASRQRLEILLMLVLLSACLTLLTVVGVDSLNGHYIAG